MRTNKWMLTILFVLLLFIMIACSNNNESGTGEVSNTEGDDSELTEPQDLILATTTSTQDTGLLDVLIPLFEEKHNNINVKTIAVGTGQALAMGEQGEADVLLTHSPAAEEVLVENEAVINRKRVMYNDFIIVGPVTDPAQIEGFDAYAAFKGMYEAGGTFVSRGDDSGTHKMELQLWKLAGLDPTNESWYLETGQGMGASIQLSAEREGYILTDRATYLAHAGNIDHMVILVEGDEELLNIYHVMQVNDSKHDLVNGEAGRLFVEFMVSEEAQEVIKEFGVEQFGQPLFFQYTE
ncbi:MAG: substrate-binding domain-containing protein [Bacillus sp. (in: Bacteria)]|nr:substrate-binding domain-containing protein [Bacillus sp. (in: firmicutes)]